MKTKGTVSLIGLEFFAHHGIYDFEREKGNIFWIDIFITKEYENAELSSIDTTIDYEKVYALIDELMQQPEGLLETVASKIVTAISVAFPGVEKIKVVVKKNAPPIKNAKLSYSAFELEWESSGSKTGEN